jgi:lon-related putative ATP-dependent protease
MGLLVIPLGDGKPMGEQEFLALPAEQREAIQKKREQVTEELRSAMRKLRSLDGKINDDLKQLNKDVALFTMGHLVNHLKEKFSKFPDVVAHINAVQDDIVENIMQFITGYKPQPGMPQMPWMEEALYRKYEVNVIVDNSETDGAPVIVELNPTYQNVFGKLEKEAQFGMLTTDFSMIVGGAIHRANGGYLVLPVDELLRNGISWEGLKMALKQGEATIEEPAERFGYISTRGMKPQPIPLSIKVVLIGTPSHYQALVAGDPDFPELFKVRADFDATMQRDEKNIHDYAVFVCNFCKKEGLRHLEAGALCRLVEHSSRLAQQKDKLSTHFALIADIIREADFYAKKADSELITAEHISSAIDQKIYRSSLIEEKIQEMFDKGQILLDTAGSEVGQVNGLSVLSLGDYAFGRPSRVTVSTGIGKDGVVDIEREAQMGGPTHTKGVMILGGYLLDKYAKDKPLGLSARLVFEQSYSGVDGDSASSTELYAILSSLSGIPIRQYIAVTGSVNQKGEVQPIGGVNEKIEGYFAVCKAKGLTGEQGVMIPASNVQNLMLKEEVVQAVNDGRFHIWPVATIDEGIEVLTGVAAGAPDTAEAYPEGTIHYLVNKRLDEMALRLKSYSK